MENQSIRRRQFLLESMAGGGLIAATGAARAATGEGQTQAGEEVLESTPREVDVLVVGGGTAGTIAAIQAAKLGARTMLVERGSQLGGTTTVGGVAFPGLFHAWGRQIIAGIGWELVRRTVALDGGELPDFSKPPARHWHHQVLINPYLYSLLAEEACQQAGATICYYEFPLSIENHGDGWAVEVVGPGTRRHVKCKQLIDCTGGADVCGMLRLPRLRDEETQPGSLLFKLGENYRPGRQRLDAVYVHGADSSTSATRTRANLLGRRAVLKQLRDRLSTDKTARLTQVQPEAAFRESYRIVGETVISHADYVAGRRFDDAVCYAFYPVDLHTRHGVKPKPLAEGVVPTIPLRALVPKDARNVLVAGRCVSSDRLANSGLRVQAPCMAMGQAAGAVAALAAARQTTSLDIPLEAVRTTLREQGAIVPG